MVDSSHGEQLIANAVQQSSSCIVTASRVHCASTGTKLISGWAMVSPLARVIRLT